MPPRKSLSLVIATGLLMALLGSAARAQGGPCAADRQAFCKDVKGGPALKKCFDDHRASLSEDCQHFIDSQRQQTQVKHPAGQQPMQPCRGDMQTLCKDVQPGGGRILECLQKNRDKLSAACAAALPTGTGQP
jgi:hypothetical protein